MCAFYKCSSRSWLAFLAVASAVILSVALLAQYGFHLHPCELCMLQRYPYAIIVVVALSGRLLAKTPQALWAVIGLCDLLLMAETGIAAYHAGVELGWFPGPTACSSNTPPGQTLEDMRKALLEAPLVACDQPMIRVLGISMAGWNAMAAAFLFIVTYIFLAKKKP